MATGKKPVSKAAASAAAAQPKNETPETPEAPETPEVNLAEVKLIRFARIYGKWKRSGEVVEVDADIYADLLAQDAIAKGESD